MGKQRKARKEIELEEQALVAYMDPLDFGTDKDPCFGKLYSLTAAECTVCGDAVFCSNRFKLLLSARVKEEEADGANEDLEILKLENNAADIYIKQKVKDGKSEKLIIKLAKKKFQLPKGTIIDIINKHK